VELSEHFSSLLAARSLVHYSIAMVIVRTPKLWG